MYVNLCRKFITMRCGLNIVMMLPSRASVCCFKAVPCLLVGVCVWRQCKRTFEFWNALLQGGGWKDLWYKGWKQGGTGCLDPIKKKRKSGKHLHLAPLWKLTEGFSPSQVFPWILKNDILPVHLWADHLQRHCWSPCQDENHGLGLSLEVLALARSPLTPKWPSVLGWKSDWKALKWRPGSQLGRPQDITIWWSSKRVALGGDPAVDLGLFSETICPIWLGTASGATRGSPGKRGWRERLLGRPKLSLVPH